MNDPLSTFRLDSQVALVTGASSGIGASIARLFAIAGARVCLVGRDLHRLRSVADEIARTGGSTHCIQSDLTQENSSGQVVRESIEVFKRIDILIHSAGIYVPRRFPETDLATLDRQWAINVRAAFALTQEALPELIRRHGKVVFVSSIDGHVGFAGDTAYAATKGAVDALVRALGMELASLNVRVNALAPGFTATPMNQDARADAQILESVTSATPLKRLATVEDIAHAALFLASDAAAFIVGTVLPVDGGYPASVVQQGAEDPVPPPS